MTHITYHLVKCNISASRKVERIQNYKLLELIGEQSKHNPNYFNRKEEPLIIKRAKRCFTPKNLKYEVYP